MHRRIQFLLYTLFVKFKNQSCWKLIKSGCQEPVFLGPTFQLMLYKSNIGAASEKVSGGRAVTSNCPRLPSKPEPCVPKDSLQDKSNSHSG